MSQQRPKLQQQIEGRIHAMKDGEAFTASDFLDISGTDTANKALSRLAEDGSIRRVMQGLYDKPEYSELLHAYSAPRMDKVAEALSRKFNWTIAPAGDTALNLLHLSTQVPNTWEFVSDGPARRYDISGQKLFFRPVKQREIAGFHKITVMVVQALRAIGKENVTDEDINVLREELSEEDKKHLCMETRTAAAWIISFIKEICKESMD